MHFKKLMIKIDKFRSDRYLHKVSKRVVKMFNLLSLVQIISPLEMINMIKPIITDYYTKAMLSVG